MIGHYDFSKEVRRQASITRLNVDHRFLSYPFDHYGNYRPIQEAIRQAFITYSSAHYSVVQPGSKVAECHVEDLKKALEMTDLSSCWGDASQALLWALFQGAHLSFGQRERPWFVAVLTKAASCLRLRTWMQARAVLVRFYYIDRVFQNSFRRIWDEVEILGDSLALLK
jgi:hypothetical protein